MDKLTVSEGKPAFCQIFDDLKYWKDFYENDFKRELNLTINEKLNSNTKIDELVTDLEKNVERQKDTSENGVSKVPELSTITVLD